MTTAILRMHLLPFVAAAVLAGCASAPIEVSVQTRAETYRQIGDPHAVLFSEPPQCAALPAIAGDVPGFGIFMNTALERVAADAGAGHSMIGPSEAGNLLSEKGLRTELDTLMNSWRPTSILAPKSLARIGEALDVPYLLVPYLVSYDIEKDSRFVAFGLTVFRSGWTTMQLALQLWHAPTGTLVWQGHGISTLAGEGVIGAPVAVAPTLEQGLRPMLNDFLTGRSETIVQKSLRRPEPSEPQTGDDSLEGDSSENGSLAGDSLTDDESPPSDSSG
ncbi:MAG: hypothetical protein ACO3YY_08750 [Phycisphaerales bacterium]|jgi:hypothetical protein